MRVLFVDDYLDTRIVCSAIIDDLGHTCEAVSTVAAAIAAAARQKFDLLVCDILLPDGLGYDLMGELSRRYGMRGIALSGCSTPSDFARSRAAGFAYHLVKPVDFDVLATAIRSLAPPTADDLSAGTSSQAALSR